MSVREPGREASRIRRLEGSRPEHSIGIEEDQMAPGIRLGIEELETRIAPALLAVTLIEGPNVGREVASTTVNANAVAANVNSGGVTVEP
jgi:hypothetical protein